MDVLHWLTLGDVLRENRRTHPTRIALVCDEQRYTFRQLDDRVNQLANALHGAGVTEGNTILWLGQNCHRLVESLLAAAKIGAVFCPANWRQSPDELAFVIGDADPAVVVWQEEEIGDAVRKAREIAGSNARWVQLDADGDGSLEAFLSGGAADDPEQPIDPSHPVLQIYTAAFEGVPNGALLSHTALIAQHAFMALMADISNESVYLASGPLFHIWTFINVTTTLHFGGKNVIVRRVDPEELCRLIDRERCTFGFILGPTQAQMAEANTDGRYDLTSFRSPPGYPAWNEMVTVVQPRGGGYGQTEVAALVSTSSRGDPGEGSHGRTSPFAQVRIVDDGDAEVPPGEVGEIVVRGPVVMTGYRNRPEVNERRQRGAWHHTNDLGRREQDGSLTFIGPKTAMIKSAAENIYPAEVEACIRAHPAVQDVCVIGIPDPTWTQAVKAVVVLQEGKSVTAEEIIDHCRARIASYKKPRTVEFVDALPRTAAGMVDRAGVDAAFGGGGYPGLGG